MGWIDALQQHRDLLAGKLFVDYLMLYCEIFIIMSMPLIPLAETNYTFTIDYNPHDFELLKEIFRSTKIIGKAIDINQEQLKTIEITITVSYLTLLIDYIKGINLNSSIPYKNLIDQLEKRLAEILKYQARNR